MATGGVLPRSEVSTVFDRMPKRSQIKEEVVF